MSIKITQKIAEEKVSIRLKEIDASLIEPFVYTKAIKTQLHLKCNIDGNIWYTFYNTFINMNSGCNICVIKKKSKKLSLSQEKVNENINNKLKELNLSLTDTFIYENSNSKLKLKCNIDGYEWDAIYSSFIKYKIGCKRCDGQVLYEEEVKENINRRLKEIDASLRESYVYIGCEKTRLKLKCNKDEYEWETKYSNFVNNKTGCSKCSKKVLYKEEIEDNVNERLMEINATLREPYIYENNYSVLKLKCNIDGHKWESRYYNFVNSKKGCAKCAKVFKLTQKETEKKVIEQCRIMNYNLVEPFIYLTMATTTFTLKCNKCDHTWPVRYNNFINSKSGCPKCSSSKGEQEIEKILKERNIPYATQKTFSDCKDVGYLLFDFYLPLKNMCIEFDGIQHFESFDFFGGEKKLMETQKRDKIQTQYGINNKIELVRIHYTNLKNIKEILLDVV